MEASKLAGRLSRLRRGRGLLALLAVALLAVAFGGCASGESSSTSSSGGSGGTSSAELKEFEAKAAAALEATPKQFSGPTESVPAPTHFKLALISCASVLSGCQAPTESAAEAARSLGWDVRVYDGEANPQKANAAMLNALAWGAEGIGNMSIGAELVQQGLTAAKSAGVPVFSGDNGTDSPNPIVKPAAGTLGYAFDVAVDWRALGRAAADWIIADGKGKSNVVVYQDKEYPGSLAEEAGLLEELEKCKGCTLQPLQQFTASQVESTLPGDTVSFIRQNPDVEYMWAAYDPAAVVQAQALKQAGLGEEVKMISTIGAQQNLDLIRKGEVQVADAAYDNEYLGYASIDQFLRMLAGQKLFEPTGENDPYVILDKSNLTEPGKDWVAPYDSAATFKKLWIQK